MPRKRVRISEEELLMAQIGTQAMRAELETEKVRGVFEALREPTQALEEAAKHQIAKGIVDAFLQTSIEDFLGRHQALMDGQDMMAELKIGKKGDQKTYLIIVASEPDVCESLRTAYNSRDAAQEAPKNGVGIDEAEEDKDAADEAFLAQNEEEDEEDWDEDDEEDPEEEEDEDYEDDYYDEDEDE